MIVGKEGKKTILCQRVSEEGSIYSKVRRFLWVTTILMKLIADDCSLMDYQWFLLIVHLSSFFFYFFGYLFVIVVVVAAISSLWTGDLFVHVTRLFIKFNRHKVWQRPMLGEVNRFFQLLIGFLGQLVPFS